MRTHIDWITFTMPMIYMGLDTPDAYANAIKRGFMDMFGEKLVADAFGGEWSKNEHGRAPYTDSWKLDHDGITLFASPTLTHCCVEIAGAGCELLLSRNLMVRVMGAAKDRCTRIDIACDIETQVTPPVFVSQVKHERMRTSGHYISETGETCYVGSQKSDRFARVYRYNDPHPRCHLLRVEHVFRRDYAKAVARACIESDILAVANAAGMAFGWNHPAWKPGESEIANIALVNDSHKGNNTVFWIVDTVAPCFRKLVENGTIKDAEAFVYRYFLSAD